jgi:hypothetical protein
VFFALSPLQFANCFLPVCRNTLEAGRPDARLLRKDDTELEAALTALLQQEVGGSLVASDPFFDSRRARLVAFARENRLPGIYQFREYALDGGLISYGPSLTETYR